jgi:hypothetical protein
LLSIFEPPTDTQPLMETDVGYNSWMGSNIFGSTYFYLRNCNQIMGVLTSKSWRSHLKLARFTEKTTDLRKNCTFLSVNFLVNLANSRSDHRNCHDPASTSFLPIWKQFSFEFCQLLVWFKLIHGKKFKCNSWAYKNHAHLW